MAAGKSVPRTAVLDSTAPARYGPIPNRVCHDLYRCIRISTALQHERPGPRSCCSSWCCSRRNLHGRCTRLSDLMVASPTQTGRRPKGPSRSPSCRFEFQHLSQHRNHPQRLRTVSRPPRPCHLPWTSSQGQPVIGVKRLDHGLWVEAFPIESFALTQMRTGLLIGTPWAGSHCLAFAHPEAAREGFPTPDGET